MENMKKERNDKDSQVPEYLNPAPEYEKPFRPIEELIFSGQNKRNTYSEDSINIGNYQKKSNFSYK